MNREIRNLVEKLAKSNLEKEHEKSFVPKGSIPRAMHVDSFSDDTPDVSHVRHGSMFMITVHLKNSPLYGKTLLLQKLKNGFYKLVTEDGEKDSHGPQKIIVDMEKSLVKYMNKKGAKKWQE